MNLLQFVDSSMMQAMMQLPPSFKEAVQEFENAKFSAASTIQLKSAANRLVDIIPRCKLGIWIRSANPTMISVFN